MNHYQSQANSTTDLMSILLANFAINPYTDKLCLFVIIPISLLGTLFNLISFGIFCKKTFGDIPLFKYMRAYTLSSLIVSSSLIFSFYCSPYSIPELFLTYSTRIYDCKVPTYVTMFFFFYGNVLDIFINIERASYFSNGFKIFKKISPYTSCLILLLVCVLVNGPNYLLYDIVPDDKLSSLLRLCKLSEFTWSPLGKILLLMSFIIQGPVVMILVILTNIIAVISFRRFLKRKAEFHQNPHNKQEIKTKAQVKKTKKLENINKNLLLMTFYFSIFSVIYHVIQFSAQFVVTILKDVSSNWVSAWFVWITMFVISFKNFSNIFFFYRFNSKFRNYFLFCRKRRQLNK